MAQASMNSPTLWERTKGYSNTAYEKALKPGWNKAYAVVDKLGPPVNRLSNKVGSEAFWPTSLDKESDKAARILRSFCKDGFYDQIDEDQEKKIENRDATRDDIPKGKQRVLQKIPEKVIRNAKGLAIFTTMRTGWVFGGSGGAGVLVARHPETGEWSPPSGLQIQNLSFGFLIGVDIYDTVLVINSYKALEAFKKLRCTLGTEVGVAAGPIGLGGALDTEVVKRQSPIWSYVKSRGLYAGIALEGNLVIERTDENARFYGEQVGVSDILVGKLRYPPAAKYAMLMATLKAAQGDQVDESELPDAGQSPSDMELIVGEGPTFGIPDPDDSDPFGVKALEAEGLNIREAGTHQRPSAEVFEFKPAPTSPIYSHFARKSVDSSMRSRTWRDSTHSLASIDRGTQTAGDDDSKNNDNSPIRHSRGISPPQKESQQIDEADQVDDATDRRESFSDLDSDAEIQTAVPVTAKARVVHVAPRPPPALPPRNPERVISTIVEAQPPTDGFDQISLDGPPEQQAREHQEGHEAISKTTSQVGDDNFQSIPPTPNEEEKDNSRTDVIPGSFQ